MKATWPSNSPGAGRRGRPVPVGWLLAAPALATIALLYLVPLAASVVGAFEQQDGGWGLGSLRKAVDLYGGDILFTAAVVLGSTALIGLLAVAMAGYLVLGASPWVRRVLNLLYRWPMFVPFIVAGQVARTFLAKNGLMNNTLVAAGILDPLQTTGFLDWRGIVITFVWKQTPFVVLLLAGALASLDRSTFEAARNLGAGRLRILLEIALPQAKGSLMVALVLAGVTMMSVLSVLSVPLMVSSQSPTLISSDIAFRIQSYGDYGVANALGLISLAMTSVAAWFYLRHNSREQAREGRGAAA